MKRFLFILMATVLVMGNTVTAFAYDYPSDLPPIPEAPNSSYEFYLVLNDLGTTKLMILDRSDLYIHRDNDRLQLWSSEEAHMYIYRLTDGEWDYDKYSNGLGHLTSFTSVNYGNFDLYDDNGELVFPLPPDPLAEEIMKLTGATMKTETLPTLNQTMLVVVLCGVGCLALLISLPLLSKTLRIFHKQ